MHDAHFTPELPHCLLLAATDYAIFPAHWPLPIRYYAATDDYAASIKILGQFYRLISLF